MPDAPPIALLAAMPLELAPLRRALGLTRIDKQTHRGSIQGHKLITHVTGIGADRAIAAADRIIASYHPHTLIHLGLAGGLNPALTAASVLHIRDLLSDQPVPPIRLDSSAGSGTLLTTSRPVTSPSEKASLHKTTGADAVDMETYPLAQHLADTGIGFISLRAISDPAHRALPAHIDQTLHPDGSPNLPGAVRLILKNPATLITLAKLGGDSKRAARQLAAAVIKLLESNDLTPSRP